MNSSQLLHDAWLILTVIATLEIFGIGLYLWKMSEGSRARRFLRALAIVLFSVGIEQITAEIKNFYQQALPAAEIGTIWLFGRAQEAITAGLVLSYLIFGRNGSSTTTKEDNSGRVR